MGDRTQPLSECVSYRFPVKYVITLPLWLMSLIEYSIVFVSSHSVEAYLRVCVCVCLCRDNLATVQRLSV